MKPGAWPRLVEGLLLRPPAGGGERVAGRAGSSGRDEARSSASVSGEKIKIKIDDPGAGRLPGGLRKPHHGSRCWTEMLSL